MASVDKQGEMKSTFKDLVFGICGLIGGLFFWVVVAALLVAAVYTGGLFQWLREVFSILWFVAAFAAILFAAIAFSIERDERQVEAINAKFDDEFSKMYDLMEKDPAWAQTHLGWQDVLRDRRNVALSNASRKSGGDASLFWMLATGCALASILMLAVTAWRCVRGSP